MNRICIRMVASMVAAILFLSNSTSALSAESAIVVDGQTGRVLYEKNSDKQSLIASTTKIMTALVVCEHCNVLDRMRIPKEAVGIEGSSIYLREGEILTIQELLYGMMLHSGNDAATALAIYCGGTVEGFAGLMNDKAKMLGLSQSHFVNPHGLDAPNHYSTARDLAVLASYAMGNPIFAQTVSAKTVTIGERYLRNHNKLLWQVDGADGVKTGFTKAAGRILVSSAVRHGRRILVVTINAPDDWRDHKNLLENSFSEYMPTVLIEKGQSLGTVEIAGGTSGYCQLIAGEQFSYAMRVGEKWHIKLPEPGFIYAPICQGQYAGKAHIYVDDVCVGSIFMVYMDSVERKSSTKIPWYRRLFSGGIT